MARKWIVLVGGRTLCARRMVARSTYGFPHSNRDAADRRHFPHAGRRAICQHQRRALHTLIQHSGRKDGACARHDGRSTAACPARAGHPGLRATCVARVVDAGQWPVRPDPIGARTSGHSRRIAESGGEHDRHRLHCRRRGPEPQRRVSLLAVRPGARVAGIPLLRSA